MKKILVISGHKPGERWSDNTGTSEGSLNEVAAQKIAQNLSHTAAVAMYPAERDYYKDLKSGNVLEGFDFTLYDYVFEVHFNSYDTRARGFSLQLHKKYKGGISVERAICAELKKYFKARGEDGIVRREDLLNMNTCYREGVDYALVEICFHDNLQDIKIYAQHSSAICCGIARAISSAFGLTRDDTWVVTGCKTLNVRATPNGKVISVLTCGDAVEKIEESPDEEGDVWFKVKSEDGRAGYVWPKYLK